MTRILKSFICLALGVIAVGNVYGFSNWGPLETWQTTDLDYVDRYLPCLPLPNPTLYGEAQGLAVPLNTELGGTKNLGEGSRLNIPIITYGYDTTFLTYFGAQGVAAVDAAFAVLNGLPKVSSASAKLTEFITQGNQQVNYSAQAMRMLDLKSSVLWLMMEHMGLIGETHTYDLEERVPVPGAVNDPCAFYLEVLLRNFDPITYSPSQYVNGTLVTYQIGCLDPEQNVGDACEQTGVVGSPQFSCVATREALQIGGYYLRITRDDMGGLRYLYRHNRYVNEGFETNTILNASPVGTYTPISLTASNSGGVGGVFSALVGGVEKITFVKTPYNSLLGDTFTPITYRYTVPWVTNGVLRSLSVTRTVTTPDIIFTAGDLSVADPVPWQYTLLREAPGGSANRFIVSGQAVSPGLVNTANAVTPAVISPGLVVTFNNSGLVYYNQGTSFSDASLTVNVGFIWGSFDGSTNAPIPFPTGTSVDEIEAQVLSAGPETELSTYVPVSLTAVTNTTTTSAGTP
jgi:hypothetical protein